MIGEEYNQLCDCKTQGCRYNLYNAVQNCEARIIEDKLDFISTYSVCNAPN